jgi:hypothetical protein
MKNPTSIGAGLSAAVAAAVLAVSGAASAQTAPDLLFHQPYLDTDQRATFDAPIVLGPSSTAAAPAWTSQGLWADRPALYGLATIDPAHVSGPVWDPSSESWYARVYGMLVQVRSDGSLPVVLQDLPGYEFDVRAARGLVVYRDAQRDEVVLERLDGSGERRVLFEGYRFFSPQFSPDGSQIVVSESRSQGGHIWQVEVEGGQKRDLGRGNMPAWSADGRELVFVKLEEDGYRHTASSVFLLNPREGQPRLVARTEAPVVLHPRLSPDGRWIAFIGEATGQLMMARVPSEVK